MKKITLGIIREGKVPVDHRVPFIPARAAEIKKAYPQVDVICEPSDIRCFTDEEYREAGLTLREDMSAADVLFGVKEVPIDNLLPNKTYFFFSHTIKAQDYNRDLLRAILKHNIRLIDYEVLTDSSGARLVAFGRYAGIVGAYNGIRTYGQRFGLFDLRKASDCFDLQDLKREYAKVALPPIKIVLTGSGRVAKGAMEVLDGMGIRKVSPEELLNDTFDEPVYGQLRSLDYNKRKDGQEANSQDFYANPKAYETDFTRFTSVADVLIACAYWDPNAPVLFTEEEAAADDFKIRVIADITCDINGSIPTTKQPSTIADPVYDYNPATRKLEAPYSSERNISVMAVDNLPCELPRDASEDFGADLMQHILPHLLGDDTEGIIERATIAKDGRLMPKYAYLQAYVNGGDVNDTVPV